MHSPLVSKNIYAIKPLIMGFKPTPFNAIEGDLILGTLAPIYACVGSYPPNSSVSQVWDYCSGYNEAEPGCEPEPGTSEDSLGPGGEQEPCPEEESSESSSDEDI